MSKRISKKRKREKKQQADEVSTKGVSPYVVLSIALVAIGLLLCLVLVPMFAPQNPLTAWDYSWETLPGTGEAVRPFDQVREAYAFAARHPEVTNNLPCFCGCSARLKHKGLTDCFVKGWTSDRHPIWDSMGFT